MKISEFICSLKNNLDRIQDAEIEDILSLIYQTTINNKSIYLIGNGGSASNASHFSQDLSRITILNQNLSMKIKAFSLTDNVSFITAVANDFGFEQIFTSQLQIYASEGDLLIAISCSGNSKNIINAVNFAKANNINVLGVTGFLGGKLKEISDYNLHVPVSDFGIVESIHSIIFHFIVMEIEKRYSKK